MVFNIGDKVRLKDDHPDSQWVVMMIYHDLNKVGILHSNDFGTQMQVVDPLRLTRIDPLDEIKQAIREVLLSDEFLSAFAKAFANTPIPSTIQYVSDLSKELVKAWTCENGKAKQVYPEQQQPPDGYRWLEVGEVIRKGDQGFEKNLFQAIEPIKIGMALQEHWKPMIRRNKFEVGEKVVHVVDKEPIVYVVDKLRGDGAVLAYRENGIRYAISPNNLAPYIEETTEPPKEQPQLPHGWRWLEEDEVIRKGDGYRHGGKWWDYDNSIGAKVRDTVWPSIRRNRFEVGEKVVECVNNRIGVVKDIEVIGSGKYFLCHVEMQDTKGVIVFSPHQLAPYIEETT